MTGFARAFVMGNVARDPMARHTAQGKLVALFSVAAGRKFKDGRGELQERVSFLEVEAFGMQAEVCVKFLHRGDPVVVEGDIRQARLDGEDGNRRSIVRIAAQRVHFLPRKRPSPEEPAQQTDTAQGREAHPPKRQRKRIQPTADLLAGKTGTAAGEEF